MSSHFWPEMWRNGMWRHFTEKKMRRHFGAGKQSYFWGLDKYFWGLDHPRKIKKSKKYPEIKKMWRHQKNVTTMCVESVHIFLMLFGIFFFCRRIFFHGFGWKNVTTFVTCRHMWRKKVAGKQAPGSGFQVLGPRIADLGSLYFSSGSVPLLCWLSFQRFPTSFNFQPDVLHVITLDTGLTVNCRKNICLSIYR